MDQQNHVLQTSQQTQYKQQSSQNVLSILFLHKANIQIGSTATAEDNMYQVQASKIHTHTHTQVLFGFVRIIELQNDWD